MKTLPTDCKHGKIVHASFPSRRYLLDVMNTSLCHVRSMNDTQFLIVESINLALGHLVCVSG